AFIFSHLQPFIKYASPFGYTTASNNSTGSWLNFERQLLSRMLVQGYFRVLSFFDVSEAFELDRLNTLLKPDALPKTAAPTVRAPDYAQAPTAPIVETTGTIELPTGETLDSRIKYYWFGVACVELVTP